ncbi:AI-2E family transporter [Patescibacteria group bacterium]|nr:AI-2E family transporter [Patescibacteria group bacterium]
MENKTININITTSSLLKTVFVLILFVFAYFVRDVVAIILFSVVIASGIEPAARWFQKYKIPRVLSVIVVYLIAFIILGILFYLIIPPIFNELSSLAGQIPSYIQNPFSISVVHQFLPELPQSISDLLAGFAENTKLFVEQFTSGFFQATSAIFGGALSFVLIIILSFYLSVQENGIEKFLRIIVPLKQEEYIIDLWRRTSNKIGRWFKGQLLLGILVGVFVFLGLTILRVPYALTFALLSAVFELIPIFGPILSAIPPVGIAFLQSPALALGVIILYFIIQQFENHLIYPLVVRKVVGLPPVLTIIALVIGGKLGGFFGILLAVPIATVLMEILNDFEKKKRISQ